MSIALQIIIALSIVVFISLYFGSKGGKERTSIKGFFWGGSSLSGKQLTQLILSTSFSFNAILYHAWLGYAIGWSAILIQLLWVLSFIWVRKYSSEIIELKKYGTMHGSIEHYFGRAAGTLAAFASIIGFTLLIGWEITVVLDIMTSNLDTGKIQYSYILAIIFCIIVSIYTIRGGIKGNLKANTIQNLIAIIALIVLMVFLFYKNNGGVFYGFNSIPKLWVALGLGGLITNMVFSLVWQFVDMSNWQNIASASSVKQVKKGLKLSAFWVLVFPGVIGTGVGIAMSNIPNLNDNTILESTISIIYEYPWILIPSLIGFFAVMFSTLDGYLLSSAQSFSWDILYKRKIEEALDDRLAKEEESNILRYIFTIIMAIAIIGGVGTLFIHKLGVQLFHLVYIVTVSHLSLFPTVFILLINKKKKRTVLRFDGLSSILSGLLIGFGFVVFSIIYDSDSALTWSATIGLVSAFFVGLIGGQLKTK